MEPRPPQSFSTPSGTTSDNIDEIADKSFVSLKGIERKKLRVAKAYNKNVQKKSFQFIDFVLKVILLDMLKKSEIWQTVSYFGRTSLDHEDSTRQVLPSGVIGVAHVTLCYQREIYLPKSHI